MKRSSAILAMHSSISAMSNITTAEFSTVLAGSPQISCRHSISDGSLLKAMKSHEGQESFLSQDEAITLLIGTNLPPLTQSPS